MFMLRKSLVVAAMSVVAGPSLVATVVVPAEFRAIVTNAALIVRGHVTDVRAVAVPGRGIESIATVAVDAVLKGTAESFVSVRVPGGTVDGRRFVMVGSPTLRASESAVFFLTRDSENAWRPAGLSSGIARLERAPGDGRLVVRPPVLVGQTASVGRVVRGDRRRRLLSVAEFESMVRLVLAGANGGRAGGAR
jgi:hypothetical protein